MKKYIIKIISCIVIVLILFIIGFKFQNIGWDAVSACATCLSVLTSLLAIYYAIQVPKKIAENQDKIALFEKRYAFFQFFERCLLFAETLEQSETVEEMEKHYIYFVEITHNEKFNSSNVISYATYSEYMLHMMVFIFADVEDTDVKSLYVSLHNAVVSICKHESDEIVRETVDAFISKITDFKEKYCNIIWDSLYLN